MSPFLDVKIIDYAPKIFAYLRNLENIKIDKMAESFNKERKPKISSDSIIENKAIINHESVFIKDEPQQPPSKKESKPDEEIEK